MRRLLLGVALASAVTALALVGVSSAGSGLVSLSGGGTLGPPYTGPFSDIQSAKFQLSVRQGAAGTSGFIAFSAKSKPGLSYDASLYMTVAIDCISVQPLGAVLAGSVIRVSPEPNVFTVVPGERMFFSVVDGGGPTGADDAFYWSPGDEHPDKCAEQLLTPLPPDVAQGNVVLVN